MEFTLKLTPRDCVVEARGASLANTPLLQLQNVQQPEDGVKKGRRKERKEERECVRAREMMRGVS
jgi:hypothetical protein